MKAIIPVAGMGTRLRPHTHSAPKVMLPVAGKPMLAHILDELTALGFDEVTFIVGYKGDMVREFVTSNYKFKSNFVEQPEMKGLGHAISLAKDYHQGPEPLLIVLGDTIFQADLSQIFKLSVSALGVKEVEDGRRFGIVELKPDGTILRLVEKPENPPSNLAIAGIYFMHNPTALFAALDKLVESGKTTRGEIQLTDALQIMLEAGEPMTTFKIEGWYDCGKAETMLLTNRDLLKQLKNPESSESLTQRYPGCVFHPPVFIANGVKIENSIVGPYVSVSSDASIEDAIVKNTILGRGSEVSTIILEDSIISDEARAVGSLYKLNVGDSSEIILE